MLLLHRLARSSPSFAGLLTLLVAGGLLLTGGRPLPLAAQDLDQGTPPLLVDDAAAANPDLVEAELTVPDGVEAPGSTLRLPPGLSISVVAAGIGAPRFMTFDGAGNLLVAAANDGAVYRYPAAVADGSQPAASPPEPLLAGLERPGNVALFADEDGEYLYVSDVGAVTRYRYDPSGPLGEPEVVVPDLPTQGHFTRTVAFGPDGMLYLAVGSSCNICDEEDEIRATISRANSDGSDLQIIATGLRNPVGLAFQPQTDALWTTVNERDNQGNEIPPDLVTQVFEGANYGWPSCQPPDAAPQDSGADCSGITPPTVGIQAHSAPLGLAFLTGEGGIAADRADDLVVAQHGSWNREPPAAPKLLLIDFEDGAPVSARDFATGWQDESGERWGRPAGVLLAPDGALLVSDDQSGFIYRIASAA